MKKINFLILFTILAMALLGGAYAAWSDHLTAVDVVKTGIVNIQWADGTGSLGTTTSSDSQADAKPDKTMDDTFTDLRDVGWLDVAVSNGDDGTLTDIEGYTADPRIQGDKITLDLGNGYPGYKAVIQSKIINTGTVSTKFQIQLAQGSNSIPAWLHVRILDDVGCLYDSSPASTIGNTLKDTVLDPNKELPVVIVEEVWNGTTGVPQDQKPANNTFTLQLSGQQWNGDVPGGFTLPDWDNPWGRKR